MYKAEVVLNNETGLHARPASLFIKEAQKFESEIKVIKAGKEFKGKSIISVLSMDARKGDSITITAEGEDERAAVEALKDLVNSELFK